MCLSPVIATNYKLEVELIWLHTELLEVSTHWSREGSASRGDRAPLQLIDLELRGAEGHPVSHIGHWGVQPGREVGPPSESHTLSPQSGHLGWSGAARDNPSGANSSRGRPKALESGCSEL